jgi:hypothetical protein
MRTGKKLKIDVGLYWNKMSIGVKVFVLEKLNKILCITRLSLDTLEKSEEVFMLMMNTIVDFIWSHPYKWEFSLVVVLGKVLLSKTFAFDLLFCPCSQGECTNNSAFPSP